MAAALELDELLYDSLESLSLPDVYVRLREVMESDSASVSGAAEVISLDPALAARVLRMANSAFYGFRSEVDTVSRAVNILGMRKIHDLVLAASVSKAFEGMNNELIDMDTFWYRSVHAGFLAQTIAGGAGMSSPESLFVRGLLHDIGHLVLYSRYPEACRTAIALADQGLDARLNEERSLIGIDAIQFGAELATVWQLPKHMIDSFRYLMQPEELDGVVAREVAMLHVAVQFSSGVDSDLLVDEIVQRIRPSVWETAQLPCEVSTAALDDSALEMLDAMYKLIANYDEPMP